MASGNRYERAFLYVQSNLSNKDKDNKKITIGDSLSCFLNKNISNELKSEIGFMTIAMIIDQKKRGVLRVPPEAVSKLIKTIIEDMPELSE
jgi:hypothetical protein